MRYVWTAVGAALLLGAGARAGEPADREARWPDGVHRIVVNNGPYTTVRYFPGRNVSTSEAAALRDVERAESASSFAGQVLALQRQYLTDESRLQARRLPVQLRLYGAQVTTNYGFNYGGYSGYDYGGFGGFGGPSLGYAYGGGFGGFGGYGGGFGGFVGPTSTLTESLYPGVGPEGSIKEALAQSLVRQLTPEYTAGVERDLDRARARAAESPTLRTALGMPERGKVVPAEAEVAAPVTLTLKSGEKIRGKKVDEGKDWYVVETLDGGKARVRPDQVVRIDEAKPATKPAGD